MKVCYPGLIASALLLAAPAHSELVSAIQVVVNQSVITYGQIIESVAPRLPNISYADKEKFEQTAEKIKNDQIESLVERELIIHSFTSEGYQTNLLEAFIDDRVRDNIKKEYYGDRSRLIKTLQAQGMTYEMYRRQEREKFIIEYMSYQNTSQKKVLISPLKIQNYYDAHKDEFKLPDQVKLKMIAISQPADASPGTARRVAEEILRKINEGVPFAEMAAVYSSGPQRAEGGDRGWVQRSYLTPELADAAFALKPGMHSGIVELPNGACYLLMVDEARVAHVRDLAEVRDDIERTLKSQESARLRQKWIDRMKAKSFVRYY
ncbi:MAG TPA: peptidyl-prolyl cis-trans isomerase [Verrucomicrobiae bacterium]|jgi:parvulin-like peptidyl-prolyl isomerase|nr:peptidyl-prolyl cis-trans isomerase [Verrucomicrobiae bacterium]